MPFKKLPSWRLSALRSPAIVSALLVFSTALAGNMAKAEEFVFGVGVDNVDSNDADEAASIQLEYHLDPFWRKNAISLAGFGVFEADEDEDFYLGLGVSARLDLSGSWFIESSLAAGYYDAGDDGIDLGGNVQFRSLLGLGYELSTASSVSLAIDHLSNAGLESTNPGRNAVFLRYIRSF